MSQDGGALFESGLLGSSFFWWVGQIADDSVWRENEIPAPHAQEGENIGWGRRYKVRIMGLHDQGETVIPSKDLPWANVMMPVTSGGSLNNSGQTPALRQGNIVFGFFMDGSAMTVPIIMGVMGNNAQNPMASTIGDNRVTNKQPGSLAVTGYADGQVPKDPKTGEKPLPPDGDLKSEHPNADPALAPQRPNAKVNKYGLRPDLPLNDEQFKDQQAARIRADQLGLKGVERGEYLMKAVADGMKRREAQNTSNTAPLKSRPTRESPDGQHISAGDVKEDVLADEKTVMPIPDKPIQSAIKAIQTILDNITQKMDKYLNAIQSYVDAVSSTVGNLEDMICKGAMQAAKYMKVIFDKIMEFVLKQLNVVMSKVIAALPSNLRNLFGDLKEKLNEMILGLYNQMIGGIGEQLCQTLLDTLQPQKREEEARQIASSQSGGSSGGSDTGLGGAVGGVGGNGKFKSRPKVPMCYAESVASTVISKNKGKIEEANKNVIRSLNGFIDGIQGEINGVTSALSAGQEAMSAGLGDSLGNFAADASVVTNEMDGMLNMMPDIASGLGAALDFTNIIMNVFAGELPPKEAINDYYQLAVGGSGTSAFEIPSLDGIAESVLQSGEARVERITDPPPVPDYASPPKDEPDVDLDREAIVTDIDTTDFQQMTQEERDQALQIY